MLEVLFTVQLRRAIKRLWTEAAAGPSDEAGNCVAKKTDRRANQLVNELDYLTLIKLSRRGSGH
jgi:hypothetical protein